MEVSLSPSLSFPCHEHTLGFDMNRPLGGHVFRRSLRDPLFNLVFPLLLSIEDRHPFLSQEDSKCDRELGQEAAR